MCRVGAARVRSTNWVATAPALSNRIIMLWKPVTYGEDLFLRLYKGLGSQIELQGPQDTGLDFLVDPVRFADFTRLSATLEIFLRCVRCARHEFEGADEVAVSQIARALRRNTDLPARLYDDREFGECAKQTGRIASTKPRPKSFEMKAMRAEPRFCYLCNVPLTKTRNARDQFTIEHLWPLSLGGTTEEDNLISACKDCNESRQHAVTWAWGPVQSTYHARSVDEAPPRELRLSLALARLMLAATGYPAGRSLMTLKQAATKIRPLIPVLDVEQRRHYVYFEFFPLIEASL